MPSMGLTVLLSSEMVAIIIAFPPIEIKLGKRIENSEFFLKIMTFTISEFSGLAEEFA